MLSASRSLGICKPFDDSAGLIVRHRIQFYRNPFFLRQPKNMRDRRILSISGVNQKFPGNPSQQNPRCFSDAGLNQIDIRHFKIFSDLFYLIDPQPFCPAVRYRTVYIKSALY